MLKVENDVSRLTHVREFISLKLFGPFKLFCHLYFILFNLKVLSNSIIVDVSPLFPITSLYFCQHNC